MTPKQPRHESSLPFTSASSPKLCRLDLRSRIARPRCDYPSFSHLALGGIRLLHRRVIGLLARCPNLESLVIHNIKQGAVPNDPGFYLDLSLPHLRRVALKDLRWDFLRLYLQKIPKHPHSSLQVLGVDRELERCDAGALLLGHPISPPQTIRIGLERLPLEPSNHTLSVTFLSLQSLVRVGTTIRPSAHPATEGPDWLKRTLQDNSNWWDPLDDLVRVVLAALPALEVVSIAFDHFHQSAVPDLRLLPDGREPGFDSPRLRTARILFGYDGDVEYRRIVDAGQYEELLKPCETKQLSLARLLDQLETRAFDYLDRLVLRVASHFTFDEAELVQLRGCVPQVDVEYSDERPDMPLPEFAREPEASGCPLYWAGVSY
ncbi:hypothetical protein L226DRAFT_615885 [Lentinus tigrinus ALCF2SS1-7]|uniref:uncharacterized protein n=1 Tax=Lentinus tigrinus ALCF2SS1-7 TaxID=1328758 RepID=UPI00116630EA|nr:hypothetical protein L226DRAFT_615885 [Lentinus tigrinus ALCF2SS1-7]